MLGAHGIVVVTTTAGAGTGGTVGGSLDRPVTLTPLARQSPPEPQPAAAPTLVWQPIRCEPVVAPALMTMYSECSRFGSTVALCLHQFLGAATRLDASQRVAFSCAFSMSPACRPSMLAVSDNAGLGVAACNM